MQRVARFVARSPRLLQLRQASQSGISASFNPKDSGSLYERNSEDTMKINKATLNERWHASSFEDLESELNAFEEKTELEHITMKTILLEKLGESKVSTAKVVSVLERFIPSLDIKIGTSNEKEEQTDAFEAGRRTALRKKVEEMYTETMRECAMEEDWIAVEKLWNARGSLRSIPIQALVSALRRAVEEGKIDAALRLYRLCHESLRNTKVRFEIMTAIGEMASKGESSIEEVRKYAMRLEESAIIESANSFLLAILRGDKLCELITDLRRTGGLSEAVEMCRMSKFALASQLMKVSSSTPLSITPSIAALLYATPVTVQERRDAEAFLFKATNNDPELVVRVLEELAGSDMADRESLAGHVVHAALSNILREKDVLSSGRIEKIIASKNIPVIRLTWIDDKLIRILSMKNMNEESKEKAVDLVSQIIIASFKCKVREEIKSQGIIKLIGHSGITDEIVRKMVEKISVDPSMGIGPNDMKKGIEELTKRGLTKRAKLLGMLKKKSQAAQRWHASSCEDLESELNALEGKKEVNEVVLMMMKTILLDKLKDAKVSTAKVVSILERFIPSLDSKNGSTNEEKEEKDAFEAGRRTALRKKVEEMYTKTMRECAMEGDWIAVEKLWNARGSLRVLPISPSLALSYHQWREGEEELSRGIISAIQSNGQSVKSIDIYDLGEIFNNLSSSELEVVAEWLKKELSLEENVVDRIKEANLRRNIRELISGGRLDEAFEVMKDSQKAIGHMQLMQAAVREENAAIIKDTFNLAASLHSKPTAMLDLAFAFLLEGDRENAESLFKNPTLKLSYGKISFFIKAANEQKRIDVIHSLFSILVSCPLSDEKVSVAELNYIATTVLRAYEQANDMDAAVGFVKEIEGSTLQVDGRLKERMRRVKKSSKYSSV